MPNERNNVEYPMWRKKYCLCRELWVDRNEHDSARAITFGVGRICHVRGYEEQAEKQE